MADTYPVRQDPLPLIKTPSLPTNGQIGMKEVLGIQEPFMKEKARLIPEIGAARGAAEEAKQAQQVIGAEGEAKATKDFAAAEKGAMQEYQGKMEREPLPAFIPSKENAQDLALLFSLVSVIGMVVGGGAKENAQASMSAMNGMLEGHQKGRADVYKQELSTFDKNFKSMVQKHSEFRKEMEDAVKLASTDKEGAMADAKLAAAKAGSNITKAMLEQGRLLDAYKFVDESQVGVDKAVEAEAKLRAAAAKEVEAERRHREALAHAERMRKLADEHAEKMRRTEGSTFNYFTTPEGKLVAVNTKNPNDIRTLDVNLQDVTRLGTKPGAGGRGSQTQQQFENITSADIGNAYFRINEYLSSSKDGKIPEGSKFLRDKGTQVGIIDAYKNYLVNATMPADLQKNDATLLGIAFDVVAARAFGRASGVTDAKIAQVVRQLPVQGDDEATKQAKMRILLNQLEEPNKLLPEEKRKDGSEYMKSPVARGLYRTYAEKAESETGKDDKGSFHYEYNEDKTKRRKVYD